MTVVRKKHALLDGYANDCCLCWVATLMIVVNILDSWLNGLIDIDPFSIEQVNPNSYNVRIDTSSIKRHTATEMKWDNRDYAPVEDNYLIPGEFYLASTVEAIGSRYYVPMLEGRSTAARHGVSIHVTAGFGDVGYNGRWTLEITVAKPIRLIPHMLIGQVFFLIPNQPVTQQYSGRYLSGNIFPDSPLVLQ